MCDEENNGEQFDRYSGPYSIDQQILPLWLFWGILEMFLLLLGYFDLLIVMQDGTSAYMLNIFRFGLKKKG